MLDGLRIYGNRVNYNADIYATMNPAKEVGGDFYDFFLIDERLSRPRPRAANPL